MRPTFLPFFRRPGRSLVAASGLALVIGATHGCNVDEDACQRSRTCAPSSGAIGPEGRLSGGAPPDDVAPGGVAGEGGTSLGGAGLGGTAAPATTHSEGEACAPNGVYACAAHAKRVQLVCIDGVFAPYGACMSMERCDTRPEFEGLCQPMVPECFEHQYGDVVCRGVERLVCGVDLVTSESLGTCTGGCVDGTCTECSPDAPPTCELNSRRSCTAAGEWDVTGCPAATPQCTEGECGAPPSCQNLAEDCGKDGNEPCCTSLLVTGGNFDRNNDPALPATISSFRLDRFEVTVGRFRKFKQAWDAGWRPDGGSGKHVHLNGGLGLRQMSTPDAFEAGWQPSYSSQIDLSDEDLDGPDVNVFATWTPDPAGNEQRPINFVTQVEGHAFCIWDGGFLPSDAEWSYATSGGDEQRPYPWGDVVPGSNAELAVHGCFFQASGTCSNSANIAPVGVAQGVARYGQLDLVGNVAEWTLGLESGPSCIDCVRVDLAIPFPGMLGWNARGLAYNATTTTLALAASGGFPQAAQQMPTHGVRCARTP